MAENVKVEIDLVSGKLSLECPESSVDSILTRLADFIPKFRDHAQISPRQHTHHALAPAIEEPETKRQTKSSNGSGEGGSKRRNSTASRAAVPESRPEVQNLELSADEPGLLAWGSLGNDWKKFLWILEAARKKGVDGLTNGEISYMMDKTFREHRAPKVVSNLKKKIKDRFVQPGAASLEGKSYSTWRILAEGTKEVIQSGGVAKA